MDITEANVKAALGTLFQARTLQDPMVQRIIAYISKEMKLPKQEIEDKIAEELQEAADSAARSPLLFSTYVTMAIERTLFDFFQLDEKAKQAQLMAIHHGEDFDISPHLHIPKGAPVFDPVTFSQLVRRVKAENPSIFPLRNPFNKKPIASPRIILVPSSDKADRQYNDVDTAAATPTGEFIFNKHFMQQCLNYSHVRGKPPKSKKYESNGGTFPDEYALVEFLVLHEFFHYTHGDFHYQEVLEDDEGKRAHPRIINFVGDYRTNYDLIKAGHEPIPMGLYNDLINYDRQSTYEEMYNLVKNELKRLNNLPKVNDVVLNKKTGTHHVVVKVSPDGKKVETRPATPQEVATAKKNGKI